MLVIVDYNMGNVRSVAKAFELLGVETVVSNKTADIQKASHLVLPGVGAFADGMKHLKELGLIEVLSQEVIANKKPILGICLGMQLMAKSSQEFGWHEGLGWVDARVEIFNFSGDKLKIPHVGWNNIKIVKKHSLLDGIKQNSVFYFVHSYHLVAKNDDLVVASCNYGYDFPAVVSRGNIFATQFHPEKSQTVGLKTLGNFINWDGQHD